MTTTTFGSHLGSAASVRRARALLVASLAPLFVAGCAADATGSATPPEEPSPRVREDSTLTVGSTLTSTIAAVGQTVGACLPLTCCFPTGSEWGNNTFENDLEALGCTMPSAYTERYGSTDWWMYSQCKVSPALLTLIADYANVAPYYSSIAVNECLLIDNVASLDPTTVFVQFDPTCSSCRAATH